MENSEKSMEKIVALCKNRGFIYPGSEIYGGLANTWDYGPLGVELKNNLKRAWWKKFIWESRYNVGIDSAILMNPQVWVASGHVGGFSDPLMDCKNCKTRHRADHIIEKQTGINPTGHTSLHQKVQCSLLPGLRWHPGETACWHRRRADECNWLSWLLWSRRYPWNHRL